MQLQLDDTESIVYDAITKYLERKRAIKKSKILSYLTKKLNTTALDLNPQKIRKILDGLIDKNVIVEDSQLTKEDILELSKRRKIYQYILDHPGAYAYQITKDLKIASHVVLWHLGVLKDFEYIKKSEINNHIVYYDNQLSLKEVKKHYYLRKGKCKRILEALLCDKGLTKTRLSKILSMHPNTIKKYINALYSVRMIRATKEEVCPEFK